MAHAEEESEGGGERWLVSYSDFITLLMVLFVVLYSMGQVDVQKYKELAQSMRTAFSLGSAAKVVDTQINQNSGALQSGQSNPIVIPGIPQSPPKSQEVASQLTQMLSSKGLGQEVSVQTSIDGVLISLSEKLVFATGTTNLTPDALPVLKTISDMIGTMTNNIRLVGHTDNSQPTDPKYANNWDLSFGRAMVVANDLIQNGIKPDRLLVAGQGSYDPIFPNDTPEHKQLNGRVDIIIIYSVDNNAVSNGPNLPTQ
ncbi:MAG: flagellar motor protein MotB [Anaerolineaceae bacterium]|nr:flagellar motor protein MotB [Anaerolineaceae bacterium]